MGATITAPDRSYEQRIQALAHANDIRSKRAELKRDLKGRRRDVLDVLARPPEWVGTMKLFDLLMAAPKIGRVKAAATLKGCGVSPSRTVGGVTARQRRELAVRLERR